MTVALPRPVAGRLTLRRPRPGLTAATAVLALALTAVAWPSLFAGDPLAADPLHVLEAPSAAHWFGTDQLGRDVFDRVVHGARHSLSIGVAATVIAVGAGILLGLLAGLTHKAADEVLSRGFDALAAFPLVLLALLFIAIAGTGTVSLIVAIGIATLPHYARVVRAQTLVVRRAPYVTHAVAFGASRTRLVLRHVLPNVLGPIPVLAMIGLGEAVLIAAGLSFLGLGPQPPSPEWGAMLSEGRGYLHIAWWASVLPGCAVTATVISLTVIGRHLQNRFEGRHQ
ncbi:peptide/nickel transport system permease protein [Actinoplanes campanulatus]|uniref:Peptide/nickel transport system permease protein n=1 Tax=Actinoplanes campanulatus TaxID=113559 RepID=A0A7W5FFS4_9ACTN|nr:ABC transporter permease [Actinoplanes campanulatus]MBB3096687.1 peptide/nickel transport system permease protein [Actinoplanes campanulatus]GGN30642.1 peptide ABC transporter permease [Actinoplanes campanulatus]GID37230.1 peptide ABC transporter permease [Actinoplanes campanulatus]